MVKAQLASKKKQGKMQKFQNHKHLIKIAYCYCLSQLCPLFFYFMMSGQELPSFVQKLWGIFFFVRSSIEECYFPKKGHFLVHLLTKDSWMKLNPIAPIHSDEDRMFMYQNRSSKLHQLHQSSGGCTRTNLSAIWL